MDKYGGAGPSGGYSAMQQIDVDRPYMKDEPYLRKVLTRFEQLKDARLQEGINDIRKALEQGQVDYAANVLVDKLYEKDKSLALSDLLAIMPQEGFDEPRRLIREGYYRTAANEINRLVHSGLGLWKPDAKALRVFKSFWSYYCG